jgi:hypothetical protein
VGLHFLENLYVRVNLSLGQSQQISLYITSTKFYRIRFGGETCEWTQNLSDMLILKTLYYEVIKSITNILLNQKTQKTIRFEDAGLKKCY